MVGLGEHYQWHHSFRFKISAPKYIKFQAEPIMRSSSSQAVSSKPNKGQHDSSTNYLNVVSWKTLSGFCNYAGVVGFRRTHA